MEGKLEKKGKGEEVIALNLAKVEVGKIVVEAIKNERIPKIYANGFINAHSNSDMFILLQQNGSPVAMLNLSFIMAKSLALKVGQLVKNIEDETGHIIMTSDEFDNAMAKKGGK